MQWELDASFVNNFSRGTYFQVKFIRKEEMDVFKGVFREEGWATPLLGINLISFS